MISTLIAKDTAGRPCVAVVLGQGDVFLTLEGDPAPGVALQPDSAKLLAYRLLHLAEQLGNSAASE